MTRSEAFLARLSELTKELKINIGGCGDCGSPWLADIDDETIDLGDELTWDNEAQTYRVAVRPPYPSKE